MLLLHPFDWWHPLDHQATIWTAFGDQLDGHLQPTHHETNDTHDNAHEPLKSPEQTLRPDHQIKQNLRYRGLDRSVSPHRNSRGFRRGSLISSPRFDRGSVGRHSRSVNPFAEHSWDDDKDGHVRSVSPDRNSHRESVRDHRAESQGDDTSVSVDKTHHAAHKADHSHKADHQPTNHAKKTPSKPEKTQAEELRNQLDEAETVAKKQEKAKHDFKAAKKQEQAQNKKVARNQKKRAAKAYENEVEGDLQESIENLNTWLIKLDARPANIFSLGEDPLKDLDRHEVGACTSPWEVQMKPYYQELTQRLSKDLLNHRLLTLQAVHDLRQFAHDYGDEKLHLALERMMRSWDSRYLHNRHNDLTPYSSDGGVLANLKNHLSTGVQLVKTAIANKKDALKQQVATLILDKGGFTDMTDGSPLFEKEKYFKPPLPRALEAAARQEPHIFTTHHGTVPLSPADVEKWRTKLVHFLSPLVPANHLHQYLTQHAQDALRTHHGMLKSAEEYVDRYMDQNSDQVDDLQDAKAPSDFAHKEPNRLVKLMNFPLKPEWAVVDDEDKHHAALTPHFSHEDESVPFKTYLQD